MDYYAQGLQDGYNTALKIMHPYEIVDEFERRVAEYAGAKYGVSVNCCTNALLLSFAYKFMNGMDKTILMPCHTYVGVPYAVLAAGGACEFCHTDWVGIYEFDTHPVLVEDYAEGSGFKKLQIKKYIGTKIIDSARRFTKNMYIPGTLYCLSFHETKLLPIGDGGMILTDSEDANRELRKMRFDGRTPRLPIEADTFYYNYPAYHCHMKPDVAARGLMLMAGVKDHNDDLPGVYPDLSKIFKEKK